MAGLFREGNEKPRKGPRMASVTIDSGSVDPISPVRNTPKSKWRELVRLRCDYLGRRLNYDCSCLVQFVKEADEMWKELGYASANDLIRKGYELEPEEIHLAVRWLELNKPEEVVGLPEVMNRILKRSGKRSEALPLGQ